MKRSNILIFLLPLLLSLGILTICYPGFMSYDSIRMLEEARSSVRGGIYPVVPVYLLRLFDVTGHGPTLMLQGQNFVLLLSMALILRLLGAGLIKSAVSLLSVVAMPTVIGCMLVLWKDVTLASLMMLSITTIFWASQTGSSGVFFQIAKWSALLLLVMSTLVRFNAITSTAVISLYWVAVFFKDQSWRRRGGALVAILIFMMASNKIVNGYSFPDLKKFETNPLVYAVMSGDMIGVSGWSRVSLIPIESVESAPLSKVAMSDIDKIYSSLGGLAMQDNNRAVGNIVQVFPKKYRNEDIVEAWLNAIQSYPLSYLRFRWDLFSEIIGAKSHATFEPTHFNRIDENPFGIKFHDRSITDMTLKYIQATSNIFLGKPWFVFLLSISSVLLVFRSNLIRHEIKVLAYYSFAAALFYIGPFFIITGTGEVRYAFPAIVMSSISIFVWIFSHCLPQRESCRNETPNLSI